MPMGLKNAPALFQRIMNHELRDLINNGVQVYLDDIIIYGNTIDEHNKVLNKTLKILSECNLQINKTK